MLTEETFFWNSSQGIQIHIKRIGPANSKREHCFLLLHDALGSIPQWKSFPQQIAKHFKAEVYLYERQGHGESSAFSSPLPLSFFHHQALEVLPELVKTFRLEKAIIVGHSDGGTIALLYAAHFKPPHTIAIAPHIFVEDITLKGIRQTLVHQDKLVQSLQKYHGDKAEALFRAWSGTWLDPHFKQWTIQQEIASIKNPLLIIQGENDEYGSMAQIRGIREAVPHSQISILTDSGHQPHLQAMDEVILAIKAFIYNS